MTKIIKGERYVATTTAKLNGARVFREVTFTSSREGEPEPFIRGRATTPDQDRVFRDERHGSAPLLVVAGSIRVAS